MTMIRLTPAAQQDLSSIWDYTSERWGSQQAEKYIREIQVSLERVAADPERGRLRDEIREGYRCYATGSHLLFYVVVPDYVDVIRILHQRMDPKRHLETPGIILQVSANT